MTVRSLATLVLLTALLQVGCSKSAEFYLAKADQYNQAGSYEQANLNYRKAVQ